MSFESLDAQAQAARIDRVSAGFISRHEGALLQALAYRLPRVVTPDHLTILGVVGAFIAFGGLVLSHVSELGLLIAMLGIAVNWLGDSLDGTLARARKIERPRYGFYVDHSTDVASQVLIVLGLGLSSLMRLDCALLGLVGYLALSVLSFIKLHVSRQLRITYFGVGPTEVRAVIAAGIVFAALFEMPTLATPAGVLGLFDVVGILVLMFAAVSGFTMFVEDARRLAVVDPARHRGPAKVAMTEISEK